MYCTRKVSDDLVWIGANDRRLAMFEGVYSVPKGISYNSYLLKDEKTVLFNTVDHAVERVFFENLEHELNGGKLDYVIVQHLEPDHSATLDELLRRHPETTVVCGRMALNMICQFFGGIANDRVKVVGDGDTLSCGRHSLQFFTAPMVHWPEVVMTLDRTSGTLFSADAFGTFGALDGALFADEVDFWGDYLGETRRYYCNIVGKYGEQVQSLLAKLPLADIRTVCPLHGFVFRSELGRIVEKYSQWSTYEPEERGVLVAYASVYGDTANAADILACRLRDLGVKTAVYDVSVTPASDIIAEAFRYSHLVFASTTYNAGIFITMEDLLRDLVAHGLKNRTAAIIENGSWAPSSGRLMRETLSALPGLTLIEKSLTIKSALRPEQRADLEQLADELRDSVNGAQQAPKTSEKSRWVCRICGYVYEGSELPPDFKCPICGRGAEFFDKKEA